MAFASAYLFFYYLINFMCGEYESASRVQVFEGDLKREHRRKEKHKRGLKKIGQKRPQEGELQIDLNEIIRE